MYEAQQEDAGPVDSIKKVDLGRLLEDALKCFEAVDSDSGIDLTELAQLRVRLAQGCFRLAVLGQFKRGKSTLLNALLGDNLLPTDILPVTAIPTYLQYGEEFSVRVFLERQVEPTLFSADSGRSLEDFLADYVTEAGNPNNRRQVDRVEINHPATILQQGVVLIDTPGIGSTFRHNTEIAYRILPQCDAALFLVSPDPPITEAELEYLKNIRQSLPRTFFLLNKVDFLAESEKTASLKFLADQLEPLCDGSPQILPISARKGLEARLAGDNGGWVKSGMEQVERNLIDFFVREKQQIFEESLRRKIRDQLQAQLLQLRLGLNALLLPEEALQERIEQFRCSLPAIEREKQAAHDLLAGDLSRIVDRLSSEVEKVRSRAKEKIVADLEKHFQSISDTEEMERVVRATLTENVPVFFADEMRKTAELVRREATGFLQLHQQRSEALIEQVRKLSAELFSIPYHAPSAGTSYVSFDVPAWTHDLFISDMDPFGQKFSRKFLSYRFRHRKTVKRLRIEAHKLLNQNVEQVNWTLRRGLDESFRTYGARLTEQLDKTIEATRNAMNLALEKHASQTRETTGRELKLRQTIDHVVGLTEKLDS